MKQQRLTSGYLFFCFILLFLWEPSALMPLDPDRKITQYHLQVWNMENGLPGNNVYAIRQTRDGFLWVGTQDGLVRFDGLDFHLFSKENIFPLKDNEISALCVDGNGVLWIGTRSGGLARYRGGEFTAYPTEKYKALYRISAIAEDRRGNLWIGSFSEGLSCLSSGKFTTYTAGTKEKLPHNRVMSIYKDGNQDLWAVTYAGIVKLLEPGTFQNYASQDQLPHPKTTCLYKTETGELWIGTGDSGLYRWKNGTYTAYESAAGFPHRIITCLYEDNMKNLWIGTADGKLSRMRNGIFDTLPVGHRLAGGYVSSIYQDREGSLWVGILDNGLYQLRDSKFTTTTTTEGLVDNDVLCIHEGRAGNLWIGTKKGLNRLELKKTTKETGKLSTVLTGKQGLLNESVVCLFEDPGGYLWIGTEAGLHRFKDGRLATFTKKDGLFDRGISFISGDRQGNTWIGTRQGLNRYSPGSGQFTTYTTREGLLNNFIRFIFEDSRGDLWVGTGGGLNRLKDGIITTHQPGPGMENYSFLCAHEDDQGILWFGTDSGLVRLHTREKETGFYMYNMQSGLIENRIYSILEDDGGYLWLAGRNGISRVSKKELEDFSRGKIPGVQPETYNETDGMKSRWCIGHSCKSLDGRLWFATTVGMAMIDPNRIKTNRVPPSLYIEKLMVDGEIIKIKSFSGSPGGAVSSQRCQVPVTGAGEELGNDIKTEANFNRSPMPWGPLAAGGKLNLAAGTKRLEFFYTAVSFINPQRIRFKIKLEGYDNDWVDRGNLRNITYTSLSPGDYTFKVIACNSDGVWNRNSASFSFHLKPYWYKTWWAISLYVLGGILGIFFFVKWRSARLEREKKRLEQTVKERTLELNERNQQLHEQSEKLKEMDQVKSRFFANISHEFRTPLTLIMGPLEQRLSNCRDSEQQRELNMMLRNSRRLLNLINQLLDLSRFDSGKMKLQAARQNIVPFLKGIVNSFDSLAYQNELALAFQTRREEIFIYYDADKLENAVINLLINAIKFTPAGGEISVTLKAAGEPSPGFLEISVRDTGVGIPGDQLEHIFDRFHQARGLAGHNHKGTGIGLALAKELVTLHHGEIAANSQEGKGSEFIIRLPMGDAHLAPGEIVDINGTSAKPGKTAEIQGIPISELAGDVYNRDREPADLTVRIPVPEPGNEAKIHEKNIILVVEDSADVRQYIRGALEPLYITAEAKDGEDGIEKAKQIIPDLIISDIMMPGKDGYEVCKEIKSQELTSHIPVILLTARAGEESIVRGLETGADDYITKPFSTKILLARIKNLIDLRRQLQENQEREMTLQPVKTAVSTIDRQFIKKLQQLIEKHLSNEDFNVEELARKLSMSSVTLYRKLQALTGETPNAYIRSYRLKRAVQLLKSGFGNVTDVSYEVGFASSAYFTKCFREKFHCLPSDYLDTDSTD